MDARREPPPPPPRQDVDETQKKRETVNAIFKEKKFPKVGQLIGPDVGGTMQEPSLCGARYYVLLETSAAAIEKSTSSRTSLKQLVNLNYSFPSFKTKQEK